MEANRKKINAAFAKMKEEAKQLGVELLTDPETFIGQCNPTAKAGGLW